jgi:hypothetical protein
MPAMKELQLCNRSPNVADAARSYGVIVLLNLMAVMRNIGTQPKPL